MLFFYNAGIRIYALLIFILSFFNHKAGLWVNGRKNILDKISASVKKGESHIWFHFASLGEFEQGRPVIERLKVQKPDKRILITFFSPSGYSIRKNYSYADHVFYLPLDTAKNVREFISLVNPECAVFTKYDYWYHYFNELNRKKIPLYVISAIFAKNYSFFRWYGILGRKMLRMVNIIFVQDENSKNLLESIGISNVIVSGDTRFDRVAENAAQPKHFPAIPEFTGNSPVFIAGSTWPEDEKLIAMLPALYPDWKFIIAPHEISERRLRSIESQFEGVIRYSDSESQKPKAESSGSTILLIDNIGMLSSIYQYGTIAYIGGGFGAGIHNTLEAAAFGLPVIFGPKYQRFREAVELIEQGAAYSISSGLELEDAMRNLQDGESWTEAQRKGKEYVKRRVGATDIILKWILIE